MAWCKVGKILTNGAPKKQEPLQTIPPAVRGKSPAMLAQEASRALPSPSTQMVTPAPMVCPADLKSSTALSRSKMPVVAETLAAERLTRWWNEGPTAVMLPTTLELLQALHPYRKVDPMEPAKTAAEFFDNLTIFGTAVWPQDILMPGPMVEQTPSILQAFHEMNRQIKERMGLPEAMLKDLATDRMTATQVRMQLQKTFRHMTVST